MFNCKKISKVQKRPPSLILFITTPQVSWIFPSQSWERKNSIIIIIIITAYLFTISPIFYSHTSHTCSTHISEDNNQFLSSMALIDLFVTLSTVRSPTGRISFFSVTLTKVSLQRVKQYSSTKKKKRNFYVRENWFPRKSRSRVGSFSLFENFHTRKLKRNAWVFSQYSEPLSRCRMLWR